MRIKRLYYKKEQETWKKTKEFHQMNCTTISEKPTTEDWDPHLSKTSPTLNHT